MTEPGPGPQMHFRQFVRHFGAFSEARRSRFARLYDAPGPDPSQLADHLCEEPERLRDVVEVELDEDARSLLHELCYDHDIVVPVDWASVSARKALEEIGAIGPTAADPRNSLENSVPAAIAAILAPQLKGMRTTLPTLLGSRDEEELRDVAARLDLDVGRSPVRLMLAVSERLGRPDAVDLIVSRLPDPEYLGAALMIIELGGVCFWQEVFGCEPEDDGGDAKVVPLMRSQDRDLERDIADSLMSLGVVFYLGNGDKPPFAIVPEELWGALWMTGRTWLMDWAGESVDVLSEQAHGRDGDAAPEGGTLQSDLKWLAVEAEDGRLHVGPRGGLSGESDAELVDVGGRSSDHWQSRIDLGVELTALSPKPNGCVVYNRAFDSVLDLPPTAFARQVLFDWVTGYVGSDADRSLPRALGLDETWRTAVLELLDERGEFAPVWLRHEGVEPELTGTGCIRNVEGNDSELLMLEIGLTNGLVWTQKLIWLDLLSLLESEKFYPVDPVVELSQLAASFSVFNQVLHVIQQPAAGYYLPVQRASFLTDPYHTGGFRDWLRELVEELFEPLGVARFSEAGDALWLDAQALRVPSPPGVPDDQREQLVSEMFPGSELDFRVPTASSSRLRPVMKTPTGNRVELDMSMEQIRTWLDGRRVDSFDGRNLTVGERGE